MLCVCILWIDVASRIPLFKKVVKVEVGGMIEIPTART